MDEVIDGVNPDRFEPGAEDVPEGTSIDDQGFVEAIQLAKKVPLPKQL